MIDRPTIAKIMDATKIEEVVSEFVTLKKRGINYVGLCPFHNDSNPSFSVSPTRGICHCFTCGKGGNAINFLMELEQMTYPDALRWLAKKYKIEIQERELTNEENSARAKENPCLSSTIGRRNISRIFSCMMWMVSLSVWLISEEEVSEMISSEIPVGFCAP